MAQSARAPAPDPTANVGDQQPLPEVAPTPVVTPPTAPVVEGAAVGGGSDGGAPPTASPQVDWRDKRIAQLTAQLKSERERRAAEGKPPEPAAPSAPVEPSAAVVDARARELAAQQEFLRNCDEMQQSGRSAFGGAEFDARTGALLRLVDVNNPLEANAWNHLLMAAHETGRGAALLHDLGANLGEAQRLLSLSPVRMAVELTKKAEGLAGSDEGLAAAALPRPVRPVGNHGPSNTPISPDDPERAEKLDIATWMARRTAQVKERGLR